MSCFAPAFARPLLGLLFWGVVAWSCLGCGRRTIVEDNPQMKFKDNVQSNAQPESSEMKELEFTDTQGQSLNLKQFIGQKNVVLVVTRGFTGSEIAGPNGKFTGTICIGCSTQTSRLVANYEEIKRRNAEVLVVFPVVRSADSAAADLLATRALQQPSRASDAPFPIALDIGLKGVDLLGIRKDLSKPATYILDKTGEVRFAYVGSTLADRPSIKAILEQLDQINQGEK